MRYGDTDPTKVQSLTLESTRWLHHRTEPLVNWQGYCKLVSTRALSHLTETTRIKRLSKDFNVLITLITLILHELTTQMIFLECLLKQDDMLILVHQCFAQDIGEDDGTSARWTAAEENAEFLAPWSQEVVFFAITAEQDISSESEIVYKIRQIGWIL